MKSKKNKKKGNEFSYKMFEKKGKKFRKAYSSQSNTGQWNHATIEPSSSDPLEKLMLSGTVRLNEKYDELSYEFNGIPEEIDRRCIEATGLNLKTYSSFWAEFILRAILHKKGVIKDPLDYIDTMGAYVEGQSSKDSKFHHISEKEHEHFTNCFEIYSEQDTDKALDFQKWLLTTDFFAAWE